MPRFNGYATFSNDGAGEDGLGLYRYELGGDIGHVEPLLVGGRVLAIILWIMLNPSEATAEKNDQTISTITRFSEAWGYNHLLVGNLYGFRTKHPKLMWAAKRNGIDIVGVANNAHLASMILRAHNSGGRVMCAWGAGAEPERVREVCGFSGAMYCLRRNKDGSPVHPLYQPADLVPAIWPGAEAA